jgi:hypothetical protein
MKLIVKDDESLEPTVALRLRQGDGVVYVTAQGADSAVWYLLTISPEGVERSGCLSDSLGFALDIQNRIKEIK